MKILETHLKNFMLFEDIDIKWSPNINIICGENSTGKTTLLKCMYSLTKPYSRDTISKLTKDKSEALFIDKMTGVFRPQDMKIGRLVSRKQGKGACSLSVKLENDNFISMSFNSQQSKHITLSLKKDGKYSSFFPIYLPPKEMISATEHFQSLYEDYHLDFEETYYDLTKLLDKPLKRGAYTKEQKKVLSSFEGIMNGQIIQKDKKFYLKISGQGEFEMGLVSEGYRKLATIIYLIRSGSLTKDSILFWDEPETNMNPKMISPITNAIQELAKMGVQVFITTHDYFVQQSFNMLSTYPQHASKKMHVNFVSLYKDGDKILFESANHLMNLQNNSIMEEFDALYDREQELIYGH